MADVKRTINKFKNKTWALAKRSTDRHVRLAVTGLSRAGKTAFITALVDRLLSVGNEDGCSNLPLFQVCRDERLLGAKRELQPDLTLASFDFDGAMASLQANPPQWPASTRNITEIRLKLRYIAQEGLLAKFADISNLYLDIVDYPGEWLLDLPMLSLDYHAWSASQFERKSVLKQSPYYEQFEKALTSLDLLADVNEKQLATIAGYYQSLLKDLVLKQGFYQAQPGRMLLPGELDGAPILAFFPLLASQLKDTQALEKAGKHSNYRVLKHRYKQYVSKVVTPFYRDYFADFDRQIVLVDCFSALNRGSAQFDDMAQALNSIIDSFRFGRSGLLKRLFSPRIDSLLFCASKVDQVTRDQQGNVLSLLNAMVLPSKKKAGFEGCRVETMAISAIKATHHGIISDPEYGPIEVISGRSLKTGKKITLYPGDVPKILPNAKFWQHQGFNFHDFSPLKIEAGQTYDHIRMDHLLEFLLGDKLR